MNNQLTPQIIATTKTFLHINPKPNTVSIRGIRTMLFNVDNQDTLVVDNLTVRDLRHLFFDCDNQDQVV